jgi:cyclophilin family peptidyl-prolyl cis-trans isomerase
MFKNLITIISLLSLVEFGCANSDAKKKSETKKTAKKSSKKLTPNQVKKLVKKAMAKGNPKVEINTSMGKIVVELNAKKAPITVKNFLTYAAEGFYKNTIFHRVMSNFMIQGGGFTIKKIKKTKGLHKKIKNEAKNGLSNAIGTLAMARTRVVDSAQAQFFINVVDNSRLNHRGPGSRYGYATFGKVVKGMDIVNKIRVTPVTNHGDPFSNLPDKMVIIKSVKIK